MKNKVYFTALILAISITLFYLSSALTDTMTVEANIFANGNNSGNSSIIRVEVPDHLFFGNVSNFDISNELKVYVNNTGNVDIVVTPDLVNRSEVIFSNLYLRKFRTSGGVAVNYTRIGNFSFNVTKPSSGQTFNSEYFYIILDLRNNTQSITSDMINHTTNVRFFAAAA